MSSDGTSPPLQSPPKPLWRTRGDDVTREPTSIELEDMQQPLSSPRSSQPDNPPTDSSTSPRKTIETGKADISRMDDHKCVNQYYLEETIGKGSYGKVKLALDSSTGQKFAIKVMNKALLKKKRQFTGGKITDMYEGVCREIAIMKKLSHPHIVRLIEVIDDPENEKIYLVLDLAENGSVMKCSGTSEPIPIDKCRAYFRDIISGLEYLHFQKVAHRDIKPENLLLTKEGRIKIADFGVSLLFEGGNDRVRTTVGSAAFMAPEMCVGTSRSFSASVTDIWSAGITLFFLLCGTCPFMAPTIHEVFEKIVSDPIEFPEEITDDLRDILNHLLEKNPEKRISIPEIKKHPWVTEGGKHPMPDLIEEVITVSAEDVSNAFTLVQQVMMVVRLKGKMNRWKNRRTSPLRYSIES